MPYMHYQVLMAMLGLERDDLERHTREKDEIERRLSENKIMSLEYVTELIRRIWNKEVEIVEKDVSNR